MEGAEQDAGPIAQGLNLRGLAQVVQLEDLPSQPLRLQQSGDDLCLYGLNLCWHMHKPHAPVDKGRELASSLRTMQPQGQHRATGHCPESGLVPRPQHHRYDWAAELMPQTCVAVG
ncbi:TPA: hypothetical protein ACH3X2_007567 [Trebouxia sp. C0005]